MISYCNVDEKGIFKRHFIDELVDMVSFKNRVGLCVFPDNETLKNFVDSYKGLLAKSRGVSNYNICSFPWDGKIVFVAANDPAFEERLKVFKFDHVGCFGMSELPFEKVCYLNTRIRKKNANKKRK